MFKLLLHLLLVRFALSSDSGDILEALNLVPSIQRNSDSFLKESNFPNLDTYQVNAKAAKESKYPWIAQVIHSRTADIPHMCTAVCIDEAIYITAARCIYTLKVKYTTIRHMSKKFEALAFVLPSKPTKQMFDDIGIIVVDKQKTKNVKWKTIKLLSMKRTDKKFKWAEKLNTIVGKREYKVVGYALKKGIHKAREAEGKFELGELNVIVSHNICNQILENIREADGFKVPCYHSCTFEEFDKEKLSSRCINYLGVEGAALIEINKKTSTLVGIATWGASFAKFELPVGFSTVNSDNFFEDLSCARLIRGVKDINIKKGYYQNLCDRKQ